MLEFTSNGENAESETLCVHYEVCVCVCLLLVNPRGGKPSALTSEAGSPGSPEHTAGVCVASPLERKVVLLKIPRCDIDGVGEVK